MKKRDQIFVLRNALLELLEYTPRTQRIGGIENGYDVPTGEALCKVIDKCELALKVTE